MVKDKSSDERYVYSQQILAREQQMDELTSKKQSIFQLLDNLDLENRRWVYRMQELTESETSDIGVQRQMEEMCGKSDYISRLVDHDRDDLTHTFSRSVTELDETRLQLQRERNSLPWE